MDEIRRKAGVSNGSFFHLFPNKQALAAAIFVSALRNYHDAMIRALTPGLSVPDGIGLLVRTHIGWVVENRPEAIFLFASSRAEWMDAARNEQTEANMSLSEGIDAWRAPLVESGNLAETTIEMFVSQIIGPAQIFCRAWLSNQNSPDPREQITTLIECAIKALSVAPVRTA